MSCNDCVRKDYCTYIRYFNHDKMVDCIEFQDRDHTTHLANTLNEEIDCKYDLATTRHIYSSKLYLSNDIKSIVYKDKEYDLKVLEAFDIIKEKKVNLGNFIYWLKRKPRTYEDYLQDFCQEQWYLHYKDNNDDRCKFHKLTQEQFDLLKEILL